MKEILINATPHLIWAGVVIAIIFFFPSLTAEFVSRIQRISISKEGVELERAVEKAQEAAKKRDDSTSTKQLQLALRRIPLNRKILWVDDNPIQNELEIEALQDAGLQ
jgi:hypothetical protein